MKKRIVSCLVLLACVGAVAFGAYHFNGQKDDINWDKVNASDYVELGEYKGLVVDVPKIEVSDEDVDARCQSLAEEETKYVDNDSKKAEKDSWVKITYNVFDSEKELEEYGVTDATICITDGGTSWSAFDKELVDAPIGKEGKIAFTPTDEEILGGENLTIKYTVTGGVTKVTPEITDEWVQSISNFNTVKEWKKSIKDEMIEAEKDQQQYFFEGSVQSMIYDDCNFNELPSEIIDSEYQDLKKSDEEYAASENLSFEQFIKDYYAYDSVEDYERDAREYVERNLQVRFMLRAIQEAEGISASEADYEEFLQQSLQIYEMTSKEELYESFGEDELREACSNWAVWQWCYENATMEEA